MEIGRPERKGAGEEGERVQQQRSCFHANVVVNLEGQREGLLGSSTGMLDLSGSISQLINCCPSKGHSSERHQSCVIGPGTPVCEFWLNRQSVALPRGSWGWRRRVWPPANEDAGTPYCKIRMLLFQITGDLHTVLGPCRESHSFLLNLLNGSALPSPLGKAFEDGDWESTSHVHLFHPLPCPWLHALQRLQ